MERLLVTGGSGLLGSNAAKTAIGRFEVSSTYHRNKVAIEGVEFYRIDLSDKSSIEEICEIRPDVIVHCAALTGVDYCEAHPNEARKQNVEATKNVSSAARKTGAYMIHISTDAVYDGTRGNYKESDATGPLNVYGETKLAAEKEALATAQNSAIVRTNIYGWNIRKDRKSLCEWMKEDLENKKIVHAFKDAYFSPIFVNDLAEALFSLAEKKPSGVFHISGSERCSKLEYARAVAGIYGLDESLIEPVAIDDMNLPAKRGKDLSLDVSKAERELGMKMPNVLSGLLRMKKLLDSGYVEELRNG